MRQNNMFNDPTEAINELAALVKKDITDINMQLDNLQVWDEVWGREVVDSSRPLTLCVVLWVQEYINSKRASYASRQAATHSDAVVSLMKSDLTATMRGFKDILEVRQENMKLQQSRRARYGKTASTALGKPLAFKASLNNQQPPRSGDGRSTVNLSSSLPRPNYVNHGGQDEADTSDIQPLISTASQEQIVAEQQNYTASRAEAVSQIESHIVDIGQLFGRLSTLIHEQGDLVQRCVELREGRWLG